MSSVAHKARSLLAGLFGRGRRPSPLPNEPAHQQRHHETMLARMDRERLLTEDTAYAPPFDLVNPWAQFYDGFKILFPLFPARFDYRYSQNYIYLTQGQLDLFRSYARYLYETNVWADGALNGLADYVIGRGYDYYAQPRKHARADKGLLRMVNKHLEDVFNRAEWWELEREFYIRPQRDGDAFLRLFPQEDGITKMRAVEPEQVRYPLKDSDPAWSFGILTDPDDKVEHLAYRIWYDASKPDGETVDASEMVMFKNRMDRNVKRGISTFFNLQDLLGDADKLLRAGRQGEAVRQSIALVRQFAMSNASTVQALQAANQDYTLPKYSPATTGASPTESVTQVQPGEIWDIPEGLEMQPGPVGNAQNLDLALQATLKAAAIKLRVPAWMLTGDVQANFAAALVAESPLTKRCEQDQFAHIKRYIGVAHKVLDIACRQGLLPEDTLDQVEVCAEGQPIAARDLKQETEICQVLYQNGLLSKRTWAAREDLDYDEEQANIANEPAPQGAPNTSQDAPNGEYTDSASPAAQYSRLAPRPEGR